MIQYTRTLLPAATGGIAAARVVRILSSTIAYCDADTDQGATAALTPLGLTSASADAGVNVEAIINNATESASYTAGAAVTVGAMLVALDGESGKVTPYDVSDYSDGDVIWILGKAHTAASGDGVRFLGSFEPYFFTVSIPA